MKNTTYCQGDKTQGKPDSIAPQIGATTPDNSINLIKPINLYNDQGDVVFGFLSPGELAQFVINGV